MSPPRPKAAVATALIAGVSLLALGCGGDSGRSVGEKGESTVPAASTREPRATTTSRVVVSKPRDPARRRYIARVDAVCRRLDPDRNSAQEEAGAAADVEEASKAYDDSIAAGESQLREISAIPVPPGEKQLIKANVLGVIRRQLDLRRQIRTALAAEDVARLQALRSDLDDSTRSLTGFARGYGFRVCGED